MIRIAFPALFAVVAAVPAAAQESEDNRIAPDAVYDVAPGLGQYTDDVLFGQVWPGDALAPRDRSLIVLSALIAMGQTGPVDSHTRIGLENGLTPAEIGEIATHLAFYSGWPYAIAAVYEIRKEFEAQGVEMPVEPSQASLDLDPEAEAERKEALAEQIAPGVPQLAEATNDTVFDDLWRRSTLSLRDRSLVTMAALLATGKTGQLPDAIKRALANGLTDAEAQEAVYHLAHYAGWPNAVEAAKVLKDIIIARDRAEGAEAPDLVVTRAEGAEIVVAGPENFTGKVKVGPRFSAREPSNIGGGLVRFEAGARSAWHTHPLGQTLYITEGCAWVQAEGQPIQEAVAGDIVVIPPDVRHWHGASATESMAHLAFLEAEGETRVTWMEHVADEDYVIDADAARTCAGQ